MLLLLFRNRSTPYHLRTYLQIDTITMRATVVVLTKCILVSLVLLVANANDDYVKGTPTNSVIALSETTFQEAIQDPANPLWFLKFYAPWYVPCFPCVLYHSQSSGKGNGDVSTHFSKQQKTHVNHIM